MSPTRLSFSDRAIAALPLAASGQQIVRPTDLKMLVQRIEVGSAEIQISGAILKLLQTVPSSEEVPVWNLVQTAFAVPFRAGSPG